MSNDHKTPRMVQIKALARREATHFKSYRLLHESIRDHFHHHGKKPYKILAPYHIIDGLDLYHMYPGRTTPLYIHFMGVKLEEREPEFFPAPDTIALQTNPTTADTFRDRLSDMYWDYALYGIKPADYTP